MSASRAHACARHGAVRGLRDPSAAPSLAHTGKQITCLVWWMCATAACARASLWSEHKQNLRLELACDQQSIFLVGNELLAHLDPWSPWDDPFA